LFVWFILNDYKIFKDSFNYFIMIHLITYGNENYNNSKNRIKNEAKLSGWFDSITVYGPDDLDDKFKLKFKNILQQSRIGGYGIWRPYIIKKKLNEINNNDILIYLDAGCSINLQGKNRFDEYIEMLENSNEGVISFQLKHLEKRYTTKEIFNNFNIDINGEIANSYQILDGILIMKKNKNLINLNNIWYNVIYDNPLLFTDHYNNNNQESYFIDNRHEQSIFSVIRKMHNPILLKDETYFGKGNFGKEISLKYPFWATRKK
jgi:hypothetical protein